MGGGTYRVLGGGQDLLDHHAVAGEGAPVECVGPVRTEGAEAGVFYTLPHRAEGAWGRGGVGFGGQPDGQGARGRVGCRGEGGQGEVGTG